MERLTARNAKGMAYLVNVKPNEQEVDSPHPNTLRCILDSFNHLAEYEDIGLTPDQATQMQKDNTELKELLRLAVEELNKNCKACSGFNHSGGGCGMGVRRYTDCRNDFFKHWQWQHADRARKVGVEV